jgi:hypothetical protein
MSNDELRHYGILRKSGRYPWGSGEGSETPYSRSIKFYQVVNNLKAEGIPDVEIAKAVGLSVADLRSTRTIAKEEIIREQTNRAVTLRDKGVSIQAIADRLEIPAPTVRLRLKNSENIKESSLRSTANIIRKNVDEHDIVDIGKGTELNIDAAGRMGISKEKLASAIAVLRDEGYETYTLQTKNVGTNHFTNQKVIVKPGTSFGEAKKMTDRIHTMGEWTENEGLTYLGIHPPLSINSKRLKVNFAEDGGTAQDGVVFVRPGIHDLNMGKNTYAQVRIAIDGTHFIKGMAVQNPDLPPGIDLVFNTNKSRSVGKLGALKELKDDPENPFGSIIKPHGQIIGVDSKTGKTHVTSAINIVNEPGDWAGWRKSLPSQMLAKQPHTLIKSQLKETRDQVNSRLDEISKITNPVVRKKAFEDFADQIDSDAVDLRAAAMPRQKTATIIPMPKMNKNEIYAPQFETGERVVLIRYPHGGRFEIPEVTVNNNNRTAKRVLGNAIDAIGIHPSVAERLSGADFDGDTVVIIPNRLGKIKGSQSMGSSAKVYEDGLKNFEPKRKYGGYEEVNGKGNFKLMTNTGKEMGMITNLITDMSIQGARPEHVVRAVRHSMVVIDAEKHKLDYKQSEIDNGISQLKELYQGEKKSGAKTLLSRATAEVRVPERKLRRAAKGGPINPPAGEKGHVSGVPVGAQVFEPTGRVRSVYDKKTHTYLPEKVLREQNVKRLALTEDAFTLVRDKADPVERLYADHANAMKQMANQARLRAARTPSPHVNDKAKTIYKSEVDDLVFQLRTALKQKPLDRRADVIAGAFVKARHREDPLLRTDRDRLKKVERQAKSAARARLGLKKPIINISDRQWDAIQAGAVSSSMLREILGYADPKRVSELAMPRTNTVMTAAITARAKAMLAAGATNADVAASLGIPASTLRDAAQRGDL